MEITAGAAICEISEKETIKTFKSKYSLNK